MLLNVYACSMERRCCCGWWLVVVDIIEPTCRQNTLIMAWGFIIEFVTSVLNILSLSYDTYSRRWCMVCSREALPVWRWRLSAIYWDADVSLSPIWQTWRSKNYARVFWSTPHKVLYYMVFKGRCSLWFDRSMWWLINAWSRSMCKNDFN